jgi:hypothetical protein
MTTDEMLPAMEAMDNRIRQFVADSPRLFEPFQIIVVDDDGSEVDLCDVSRPIDELMVEAEKL